MLAICLMLCYTPFVCSIHEGDAGTVAHLTIIQRHSLGFASKTLYQIHLVENTGRSLALSGSADCACYGSWLVGGCLCLDRYCWKGKTPERAEPC